jgi:hypothetical protein
MKRLPCLIVHGGLPLVEKRDPEQISKSGYQVTHSDLVNAYIGRPL